MKPKIPFDFPPKPKLDPANTQRLALYSTDDLRELHHRGQADFPLDVIKAEILWRVWCEDWISRLTLLAAVIGAFAAIVGAIAAIVAAVEGLR
jgi:hypothetical protein